MHSPMKAWRSSCQANPLTVWLSVKRLAYQPDWICPLSGVPVKPVVSKKNPLIATATWLVLPQVLPQ